MKRKRRTLILPLIVIRSGHHPLHERQLVRPVRNRIVPQLTEVVPEIMLQTIFDGRVMDDAA